MDDILENIISITKPAEDISAAIEDLDDFIFSESTGKPVSER